MPRSPHKAGVYAIEQIGTGRLYIGSSMDIPRRWGAHRLELARGRHHSPKLQNAWTKYGPSAFQWFIIEVCPRDTTKDALLAREQAYINNRRPWFNILPTAGSRYGSTDEEITRKRKSAARRSVTDLITHCPQGHEYSPENTYLTKRNQRVCRRCGNEKISAKYVPKTVRRNGPTCKRGHEWTPETTMTGPSGNRLCATCVNDRRKARYDGDLEKFRAQKRADYERHKAERLAAEKVKRDQKRAAKPEPQPSTTCAKGHPWTIGATGHRFCPICRSQWRATRSATESPEAHAARLARRRELERATYHEANQRAYARRKARALVTV